MHLKRLHPWTSHTCSISLQAFRWERWELDPKPFDQFHSKLFPKKGHKYQYSTIPWHLCVCYVYLVLVLPFLGAVFSWASYLDHPCETSISCTMCHPKPLPQLATAAPLRTLEDPPRWNTGPLTPRARQRWCSAAVWSATFASIILSLLAVPRCRRYGLSRPPGGEFFCWDFRAGFKSPKMSTATK